MEYPQRLLDHYRSPRHRTRLADPDASVHLVNPLCGDEVTMDVLRGPDGLQVGFEAVGCAICIGSADMAAETALGDGIGDIPLDDVPDRIGMELPPGRVRCATLGWEALQAALRDAQGR